MFFKVSISNSADIHRYLNAGRSSTATSSSIRNQNS